LARSSGLTEAKPTESYCGLPKWKPGVVPQTDAKNKLRGEAAVFFGGRFAGILCIMCLMGNSGRDGFRGVNDRGKEGARAGTLSDLNAQ